MTFGRRLSTDMVLIGRGGAATLVFLIAFFAVALISSVAVAENLLGREQSPYLRSHAADPVHWQPWGEAAFARARRENRPVFLSIGYLACHWCHVMQRENFLDPETAAFMNRNFVNVLVDREERPDVDGVMMRAAAVMGNPTGWPLNAFLTAEGKAFFSTTYLPPERRAGVPAFGEVLQIIVDAYREDGPGVAEFSQRVAAAVVQSGRAGLGAEAEFTRQAVFEAATKALADIDEFNGGFGTAPKFPMLPGLMALWRIHLRTGDAAFADAVVDAARAMTDGGIYDHLGGGFARYATDPEWKIPHFEKMLEDQGVFLRFLTEVWRETREPRLAAAVKETADFLIREMRLESGAFAVSLDADSEDREGAFYVWEKTEIAAILGPRAELFAAAYDVSENGNWEETNVLNRVGVDWPALAADRGLEPDVFEVELAEAREKLFRHRETRPRPARDDKRLADWNGHVIAALADAGAAFGEADWIGAAVRAFADIATNLTLDGRLRHSRSGDTVGEVAVLSDYAAMADAALVLFEVTGEAPYLAAAARWLSEADALWSEEAGAYFSSAGDAVGSLPRLINGEDSVAPAANAVMADVLVRLAGFTGETKLLVRAERITRAFLAVAYQEPRFFGGILAAADTIMAPTQVVIVGDPGDRGAESLYREAMGRGLPGRTVAVIRPGTELPETHPAAHKGQIDGLATAYVCSGTLCSLPVTGPEDMRAVIENMRQMGWPAVRRDASAKTGTQ